MIRCALIGNPNVGKSTLFNLLTKGIEHTGNWPGKTIECKDGLCRMGKEEIAVYDLPGSYGLSPFSEDEQVVVESLAKYNFDVIVQIADACNLERNLYFTLELLQFSKNIVVVLNKMDHAKKLGIEINEKKLEEEFGIPFVKISAKNETGIDALLKQIIKTSKNKKIPDVKIDFNNKKLTAFEFSIKATAKFLNLPPKWFSLKLIEKDVYASKLVKNAKEGKNILGQAEKIRQDIEKELNCEIGVHIAKKRYGLISKILKDSITYQKNRKDNFNIDRFILNPWIGSLIFILALWLMFQFTFILSAPFSELIDGSFSYLGEISGSFLENISSPPWLISLLQDGIIAGVGGILTFTPNIAILFIVLYSLEDSGYMARVAVVLDSIARKIGFSGKSFIPLILGFGCNVPAIMSTRILDKEKDRLATMLSIPFMSCSARLPVYLIFVGAFFSKEEGLILLFLYLLGVLMAIITAYLLKALIWKSEPEDLLIELPRYHIPSWKVVLTQAKNQTLAFVYRAGTIIFAASVLIWFLASMPYGVEYGSKESYSGAIGGFLAPLLEPLGFGTWQASISLLFGFVAKEVVVSSMLTAYGVGDNGLTSALGRNFTPLSAISFMVFVLLYVPCLAVLATLKRETGSWKITLGATIYYLLVAWLIAFIIFQAGKLFGY